MWRLININGYSWCFVVIFQGHLLFRCAFLWKSGCSGLDYWQSCVHVKSTKILFTCGKFPYDWKTFSHLCNFINQSAFYYTSQLWSVKFSRESRRIFSTSWWVRTLTSFNNRFYCIWSSFWGSSNQNQSNNYS